MFFSSTNANKMVQVFMVGPNLARRIDQYGLNADQRRRALAAVESFHAQLRIPESDRAAVLDQMQGILSDEERDNFRAPLECRPMAKDAGALSGAIGGVVGGVVGSVPGPAGDVHKGGRRSW